MHIASSNLASTLVIVPCGSSKIWDKLPSAGPTVAKQAYTGSPFKLNRRYAECFGVRWVILSAKYGFISPESDLSGPYEVTFKRKSSEPIAFDILKQQVVEMGLDQFGFVIGLGGKEYRDAISVAFDDLKIEVRFPFAGLPIGRAMQATMQAIDRGSSDV